MKELKSGTGKNIPMSIYEYLDLERSPIEELDLDYHLYFWAKGNSNYETVTLLLANYGSPYTHRMSWWNWENGRCIPNCRARNAIRKWANEEKGLILQMHELPLAELDSKYDGQLPVKYVTEEGNDPGLVLVIGKDVTEVKVIKSNRETVSDVKVTTVTHHNSLSNKRKDARFNISIKTPKTANSLRLLRQEQNMTWDELLTDLLGCYLDLSMIDEERK